MVIDLSQYPELTQVLTVLSLFIIFLHLFAWAWAVRVARSLRGRDGYALANIIAFVAGGAAIARLIGFAGAVALIDDRLGTDFVLLVGLASQTVLILVMLLGIYRINRLSS